MDLRNIVVAVDASDKCMSAVQYAVSEVVRPGDVLHICHVATVLPPAYTISHVAPQTTYDVPEGDINRQKLLQKVQDFVKVKFQSLAEAAQVPCFPQIILDTDNASAADIAKAICAACDDIPADMLIVAYKGDQGVWSKLAAALPVAESLLPDTHGAVLQAILNQSRTPVMIVKHYTPSQLVTGGASGTGADAPATTAAGGAVAGS